MPVVEWHCYAVSKAEENTHPETLKDGKSESTYKL